MNQKILQWKVENQKIGKMLTSPNSLGIERIGAPMRSIPSESRIEESEPAPSLAWELLSPLTFKGPLPEFFRCLKFSTFH